MYVCSSRRNDVMKINANNNVQHVLKIIIAKALCQLPGAATLLSASKFQIT